MKFPEQSAFVSWLKSLPPNQPLTKDWGCSNCPLALFLEATLGKPGYVSPSIDKTYANTCDGHWRTGPYQPGEPLRKLPAWADDFAHAIDRMAKRTPQGAEGFFRPVIPADCLRALGEKA